MNHFEFIIIIIFVKYGKNFRVNFKSALVARFFLLGSTWIVCLL